MSQNMCDKQLVQEPSENKDPPLWLRCGPVFTSVTSLPDVAGLFSSYWSFGNPPLAR